MGQNFSAEPVVEKVTERDHNESFNVAVSSCQGWRMTQEDNHSLMLDLPGEHKASFFAVFDGHGSARVSKHASEALWKHITQNELYTQGNFNEALKKAFLTFDREVNDSYNAQLAGTTAICVLIVDNVIYCANIGDSRAVASIDCECIPLSRDHKPENTLELKRILAAGGYVLGNRVNGNLALSRAFGDFHYKGNDQLPPEQQIVSPCPDIKRIELNDEVDFIVLACDGIWDVLTSEEVVQFVISRLEQNLEPGLICEQLTTRCMATDYEVVIGCDNMTILLVCYTRGMSWEDYCTGIFEKNSKRLGVTRERVFQDIETLNQEVQQSRLRPASDPTNELFYTASGSSAASKDQEAPTELDDVTADRDNMSTLKLASSEMRQLFSALRDQQLRTSTSNSYKAPPINEEYFDNEESLKWKLNTICNDIKASSSSNPIKSEEDATDTTSSTQIQQNDDDQKTSTDCQQDGSAEKVDTTTAASTNSSSQLTSPDDDGKSARVHEIHLSAPDAEEQTFGSDETSPPTDMLTDHAQVMNDIVANTVEIELPTSGDGGEAPALSEEDISPIEDGQNQTDASGTTTGEPTDLAQDNEDSAATAIAEDGASE